jgi:glutamine synthetase
LSKEELMSRYEIYIEQYERIIDFESKLSLEMASTMILPAVLEYLKFLSDSVKSSSTKSSGIKKLHKNMSYKTEQLISGINALSALIGAKDKSKIISTMNKLREIVDVLEGIVPVQLWPLPSYASMLFLM